MAAIDAPPEFAGLVDGVPLASQLRGQFDVIVFFTTERAKLEKRLDVLRRAMKPETGPVDRVAQEGVEGARPT